MNESMLIFSVWLFLVAVLPANVKQGIGYQVKLGRRVPRHPVPEWVDASLAPLFLSSWMPQVSSEAMYD